MSSFSQEQSKKKWADYEDSESEHEKDNLSETRKNGTAGENDPNSDDDNLDYDSDSDHDQLDLSKVLISGTDSKKKSGKGGKRPLSKKEMQEQKKKELEDLDSLIAEFRDTSSAVSVKEEQISQPFPKEEVSNDVIDDAKSKSKKKKKKAAEKRESPEETFVSVEISTPPVDVSEILKARVSRKPSGSSKKTAADPIKIALEVAAKSSQSQNKKKKRDKSKFNETSY